MTRYEDFGGLVRSTDHVDRDGPPIATLDERRLVQLPDGRAAWIPVTQAEKKRIYSITPKGWGKVILDREAGMSVEQLAQKYRMETETMRDKLALAYGWGEQQIYALCERKAKARRR